MCGIAGIYSLNGAKLNNPYGRIKKMLDLQRHRGPDQSEFEISPDGRLVLGNVRLAVVDPESKLTLPFSKNSDNTLLSFNGEIYNYNDIKKDLIAVGINFNTTSDTEVLYEAIGYYGDNVFDHLNGMWGFAYYDNDLRKLTLSRDVMGERHIFYAITASELIFASEVQPILSVLDDYSFDFEASVSAWRYGVSPPGRTLVDRVQRLLPGHNLVARDNKISFEVVSSLKPEKWFDFFLNNPSEDIVYDTFMDLFNSSLQYRIPLDVDFISTLSGGIDSTLINATASDYGKSSVNAIYGHSSDLPNIKGSDMLDERSAARFTANKFGINLNEIKMNIPDAVPMLQRIANNCYDGCIDDGVAPFEFLSKNAHDQGYKVIMLSEGPDDFVGGYPVDKKAHAIDKLYKTNKSLFLAAKMLSKFKFGANMIKAVYNDNYLIESDHSYSKFRSRPTHQLHSVDFLSKIYPRDMVVRSSDAYGNLPDYYDYPSNMGLSSVRALSYATKSIPDMFNLRLDKSFMRHSVEVRLPYLDPSLVEFFIALPAYYRFRNGRQSKYLLRKAVLNIVGPEIANRSKYGFASHLWETKHIYDAMDFEGNIKKTSMFNDYKFNDGALKVILDKNSHPGLRWSAYALSMTYNNIVRKTI